VILDEAYVRDDPDAGSAWPFTLAPVRQLVGTGLTFPTAVTFLVGENGSGKSTLIEALAEAYGIDVRGGHGGRRYASALDKGPLGARLHLRMGDEGRRMKGRRAKGFFLRAETAFGMLNFMSDHLVPGYGDRHLATVSHGEGFMQVVEGRFTEAGLYLMDEPESALSFSSCLRLMATIKELVRVGGQVICATHSPVLSAYPGATIYQLNEAGIGTVAWPELELVDHWRRYLAHPEAYLRHALADED
jgi:predicted ATPase